MENQLSRNEAWELLTEYTKTPALQKHALAVEAVMSHFARINGEDETAWGVTGLLHDLDYEKYPEEHCSKAAEIMKERGIDDFYIHAVCSHGYGICSEVKPESKMEKVLFTVDELTGLINALCLMRPSKSVLDLEVKSVKKKLVSGNINSLRFQEHLDPLSVTVEVMVNRLNPDYRGPSRVLKKLEMQRELNPTICWCWKYQVM